MEKAQTFRGASVSLGAIVGFCFGEANGLLIALVFCMAVDYITGWIKAIYLRNLSSSVGFRGIFKKIMILVLVSLCHMIDVYVVGDKSVIMAAAAVFYIGNEGLSILENASAIGIPFPKQLESVLKQFKKDNDEEKKEES